MGKWNIVGLSPYCTTRGGSRRCRAAAAPPASAPSRRPRSGAASLARAVARYKRWNLKEANFETTKVSHLTDSMVGNIVSGCAFTSYGLQLHSTYAGAPTVDVALLYRVILHPLSACVCDRKPQLALVMGTITFYHRQSILG